jgi:HPt (histidine-containing phosphotransfer) domain-containing protein
MSGGPGNDGPPKGPGPEGVEVAASESEPSFLDTAMAGFRERSRVSNLSRMTVIAEAFDAMQAGALPDEVRVQARSAAHTVAGSAGTFGFHSASQRARALEALLDDVDGGFDAASRVKRGLEQLALLRRDLGDPALEVEPARDEGSTDDRSTPRERDQPCP